MRVLRAAVEVLSDPNSVPAFRAVAVVALCEGVAQGVGIPDRSAELLWATLKLQPDAAWASLASGAVGRLASASLTHDVVATFMDASSGLLLRMECLNVLSEDRAAHHVPENTLPEMAQMSAPLGLARYVSSVTAAMSNTKRISSAVLDAIADGWIHGADPRARLAAIEILSVKGSAKLDQVRALLGDPQRTVRAVAARVVRELLDAQGAAQVLAAALEVETNHEVRATLEDEIAQIAADTLF